MATIDDILNASDSDEEEFEGTDKKRLSGINLEALLEDDDDDDDDDDRSGGGSVGADRSGGIRLDSAVGSSSLPGDREVSLSRSLLQEAPVSAAAINSPPPTTIERPLRTLSFPASSVADKSNSGVGSSASSESELGFLSSLERAESRELRNVSGSSVKEVSSALQMKRTKLAVPAAESSCTNSSTIKSSELDILSTQLRRNSSYKQHGPGIATAIYVHRRFFVIGTSSGLLLLFDRNQEIRQVIGSSTPQGSRCYKAVTAVDVFPNGAVILCGYLTGEICLWDVAKGVALKRITDVHTCRISRLQFIVSLNDPAGHSVQSSSASATVIPSEFTLVSVDAKGVVNRGHFSKSLWANLTAEFDLLLDGQSGIVLDMSSLSAWQNDDNEGVKSSKEVSVPPVASPLISNMNFVAFNSLTRSYIVQILPDVRVIHRWPAPAPLNSSSSSENEPSRLTAGHPSLTKSTIPASALDWAWTIKRQYRWPVLARAWGETVQVMCLDLGSAEATVSNVESRFVFTIIAENVIQTNGEGILSVKWLDNERLILLTSRQILVANAQLEILETAPLPLEMASSVVASVEVRSPEDPVPASIHVSGATLFVLSPDALMQLHFQSWAQQADALIRDGKWLEALTTVLESCGFWGSTSSSCAMVERDKSEEFFENRNKVYTERYIRKYVELAVSQPGSNSSYGISSAHVPGSSTKSHFHLVSGVCIEFCLAARRLTLLFGDIFDSFVSAAQEHIFLEALMPYILNRSIRTLPSHILNKMIDAENESPAFSYLERCIVHLDLQHLDFEFISRVMLEKKMFSGFLYVYANGVKDLVKAYRILFSKMTSISRGQQLEVSPGRRASSSSILIPLPCPEEAEIGYKMLLQLKFLVCGKVFPRGELTKVSQTTVSSILSLILSEKFEPATASKQEQAAEWQNCRFPYLSYLVLIDPGATMHCLSEGLRWLESKGTDLSLLVDMYKQLFEFGMTVDVENKRILNFLLQCTTSQLCHGSLPLPLNIIHVLIRHASEMKSRAAAENLMLRLAKGQMQVQPTISQGLRESFEVHNFWRASLLLPNHAKKQESVLVGKFESALAYYFSRAAADGYISTQGQTMAFAIFDFIDAAFASYAVDGISAELQSVLVKTLAQAIPQLAEIQLARTRSLVSSYMLNQALDIVAATATNPSLQLDLLSTIVDHVEKEAEKELNEYFGGGEMLAYMKLLVVFSPEKVFPFLLAEKTCPIDGCLELCREKNLVDATALLLERSGDLVAALNLLKSEFSRKIDDARAAVDNLLCQQDSAMGDILGKYGSPRSDVIMSLPGYSSLEHSMSCICGLLSRVASDGSPPSIKLWFSALDHFLDKKQNSRKGILSTSSEIVALAIGQVLQQFLSSMKVVVPSQDIVRRITQGIGTTNGGRFSEFKDILLSMMNAYSHEVNVLQVSLKLHQSSLHEIQARRILRNKRAERFEAAMAADGGDDALEQATAPTRVASRKLRAALKNSNSLVGSAGSGVLPCAIPLLPPPFVGVSE